MVHIKLSVAFILAAAAITPVVALHAEARLTDALKLTTEFPDHTQWPRDDSEMFERSFDDLYHEGDYDDSKMFQRSFDTHRSFLTPSHPTSQRRWGPFITLSAVAFLTVVAGTLGATGINPITSLSILPPRVSPGPPADPDSPESLEYTASLERKLQTLPALTALRNREDADEWYETRPYQFYPEERRMSSLTAGALRGPGKLALLPLIRVKKDESESYVFLHLGRLLCGHDGIIHGGLLATLLDESLWRMAMTNLPEKVGVTAQLSLSYRAPTMADQFVVIKIRIEEVKGRKATVSGRVEDLNGTVLVEASSTFVQPRYAKLLQSAELRKAMGEPPSSGCVLPANNQDLNPGHKNSAPTVSVYKQFMSLFTVGTS